jgi:glucosyl-3-phosphoglycerate phosphatase
MNAGHQLQGQADPPLSDAGRAEAALLTPLFEGFDPGRVISSDLDRARETAAIIGFPEARLDPRFREIHVGAWSGRPLSELPADHSPAWRGGHVRAPDGESWAELEARVGEALDELTDATWVVVCHGGVVRAALSHITRADAQRVAGPANASLTIFRLGAEPVLEAYAWTPTAALQSAIVSSL